MAHLAAASLSLHGQKTALDVAASDIKPIADETVATAKVAAGYRDAAASSGVRVLRLDEYKAAALSLAEAFEDDHTTVYFTQTPDRASWTDEQRWELHHCMMEYITYAHLLKGLVLAAGDNYDCVALWMPPGTNMDDYITLLRSGLWRLNYQLSPEGRRRFFDEFLPLLTMTKAQVLGTRDQDSWYLVYIGTRPSGRQKGYARRVIEHVTRIADAEERACYLESSAEVNQRIYAKMGFALKKCIFLQRDVEHVQLDIMVRQPKSVGKKVKEADADSGIDVK